LFGDFAISFCKGVGSGLIFVSHLDGEGLKHALVRVLVVVIVGRRDEYSKSDRLFLAKIDELGKLVRVVAYGSFPIDKVTGALWAENEVVDNADMIIGASNHILGRYF
tara:strand:- start:153 stop:476 length:324 start_codon:yes stop_codon:yes gene_type:complete